MRKYATSLILASTLVIGEVHTFWEHKPERVENWIIKKYEPMTVQWNIKFIGDELNGILYMVAMWFCFLYPNRTNKATVICFIALAVADMGMYFWNFKTFNYYILYLCFLGLWPITFYLLKFKK